MLGPLYLPVALAALLAASAGSAGAQGIYTCVDSKGRRHTADRPIMACIDREQVEMSAGGLAKRTIAPNQTAAERAAEEAKARQAAEERSRAEEQKKRERALVTRYPNPEIHDRERAGTLALLESGIATAHKRMEELAKQRRYLDGEVDFYKIDPSRMPLKLKRQIVDVEQELVTQNLYVAEREAEKLRVNARFDEELARLQQLWAQNNVAATTAAAAATAATAAQAQAASPPLSAARLVPRRSP